MTQDADQRRGVGQKIRNNARNIRWSFKMFQSFTGFADGVWEAARGDDALVMERKRCRDGSDIGELDGRRG